MLIFFRKHPRLGGGELRKQYSLVKWGGFLSREQNPEVCDETKLIVAL